MDGADLLGIARDAGSVFSAATVFAVGRLGRRLYGARAGLLAAALLAVSPLPVRFAHIATTDTPAVFWSVLALWMAARAGGGGKGRDVVLAGLFTGLAAATKYPAAAIAAPVLLCLPHRPAPWRQPALCAAVAMATFAAATPFVWLDGSLFWRHLSDMARTHLGPGAAAAGLSLPRVLVYAVGWAGLPALLAGALVAGRRRAAGDLAVVAGLLLLAAPVALATSSFLRYALPVTPFACLLVARALAALPGPTAGGLLLAAAIAAQPAHTSLSTWQLLSGADTRSLARTWILERAPEGGVLREPSSPCGQVDLLRPRAVLVRQAHFRRSFGTGELARSYHALAARDSLPTLFLAAGPPALEIRYQHPVCPETPPWDEPPQARLSPGDLQGSRFDGSDWYFLPVDGFTHASSTGPLIELRQADVRPRGIGAADLFRGLAWILEAGEAQAAGDLPQALALLERVWAAWEAPEAVLGADAGGRLYEQRGRLLAAGGRLRESIGVLEQALAIGGWRPAAVNELAVAWARAGRTERAIELWRQILERTPGFGPARRNLNRALSRRHGPAP